jgi:tRNA 2-thiouridine synthesizing protein E
VREVTFGSRSYALDDEDYLLDHTTWDEAFASGMAPLVGISGGLTDAHWRVIRSIREEFSQDGECPFAARVCKINGLELHELAALFPAGYLRGACKLAGITHADRPWSFYRSAAVPPAGARLRVSERSYRVDALGFLLDPAEWDESFALHKAEELGLAHGLSPRQWEVLRFLRAHHTQHGSVPTVFQTSEALGLGAAEFEALFPCGYHRGAVKLAGLRLRV